MKNREQYKRLIMFLASSCLMIVMVAMFTLTWYKGYVYSGALEEPFYRRGNYAVIALYAVMLGIFFKIYGGLQVGRLRVFQALSSTILATLGTNALTYLQLCLIGNWRFLSHLLPMLALTTGDILVLVCWVVGTRCLYLRLYPQRQLLVIYGNYSPEVLIHKLDSWKDKYSVQEAVSMDADYEYILEKIWEYRNVILADIPDEFRNRILKYCFRHDIRCYTVPKISDILIRNANEIHIFDTSLLLFRNVGLTAEQRLLKRVFDILVSLLFLAVTAPIMLLIAILIKAYDGGPVFFTQDRLTKDGRIFKVYKFRSMQVAPSGAAYHLTRKQDSRITPIGRLLRNIHFDELPQLYNILKGDMSFVGPRPECPDLAEEYRQIVPEFDCRLKVKAGLTGFAQVYGKYNTTPYDKLKLDLTYIQNYSFWLDLKLMLLTVKVLFDKENTEGVEDWQSSAATRENLEKIGK